MALLPGQTTADATKQCPGAPRAIVRATASIQRTKACSNVASRLDRHPCGSFCHARCAADNSHCPRVKVLVKHRQRNLHVQERKTTRAKNRSAVSHASRPVCSSQAMVWCHWIFRGDRLFVLVVLYPGSFASEYRRPFASPLCMEQNGVRELSFAISSHSQRCIRRRSS